MEQIREKFIEVGLIKNNIIKRGDIFYADLGKGDGSEQGGIRPVIVIQNDIGNIHSPTVIVASLTSQMNKAKLPTHVNVYSEMLEFNSTILLEQIRTLDKSKLKERIGSLDFKTLKKMNFALGKSVGLI